MFTLTNKRGVEVRYQIEAVVFFAGAVLMSLEIAGGRLLAPSYGSSVYVWGSIIGIILLSLSMGYFFGGKLADKRPSESFLSFLLIIAGVLILMIPLINKSVFASFKTLPAIYAPLMSVVCLFFLPSLLLGMVSPFAIKLKAKELKKIGKLSGNLYSLATIGSVVGTFFTTFVLFLFMSTSSIFFLLGLVLLLSAVTLCFRNIIYAAAPAVLLLFLFMMPGTSITGSAVTGESVDVTIESPYGTIGVKDNGNIREMSISGGTMSAMDLTDEYAEVQGWEYITGMEMPFHLTEVKDVLALGLGGGSFQKNIQKKYGAKVDTVEIDEKIKDAAVKYFDVKESENHHIFIEDARVYLAHTDKRYDLIGMDVFKFASAHKIPFHLATKEFFELAKQHLNLGGLFMMNVVSTKRSDFVASEFATLKEVFDHVYVFDCSTTLFMATDTEQDEEKIDEISDGCRLTNDDYEGAVITDDYAPINQFSELLIENQ